MSSVLVSTCTVSFSSDLLLDTCNLLQLNETPNRQIQAEMYGTCTRSSNRESP